MNWWSQDLNAGLTLKYCLFGAVKTIKKADPEKYYYSRYGIGFDTCSLFSIPSFDWGKNIIMSGDIWILGEFLVKGQHKD